MARGFTFQSPGPLLADSKLRPSARFTNFLKLLSRPRYVLPISIYVDLYMFLFTHTLLGFLTCGLSIRNFSFLSALESARPRPPKLLLVLPPKLWQVAAKSEMKRITAAHKLVRPFRIFSRVFCFKYQRYWKSVTYTLVFYSCVRSLVSSEQNPLV